MDYPNRKPKARPDPRGAEDMNPKPELRLAEFSAPFGEEYPWRRFGPALPILDDPQQALKPPRGRIH